MIHLQKIYLLFIYIKMKIFKSKPIVHHFKIHFPLPPSRIQSCINKVQQLNSQNTQAIFLSFNGYCMSPSLAQTLHNSFQITNNKWNVPVYTFLQQFTTSLTYFASTCGPISANPYCVIGDIGTTHQTYTNIQKLMKFFNIKLDLYSCHETDFPWNPLTPPNQRERIISEKLVNVVEENMIKTVSQRRRIPLETVRNLKSKLFTPKQALQNNLVDYIQTAQQFKQKNYPRVKVEQHLYATTSKVPNIGSSEIKVLMQVQQILSMPKVALFSMQDPFNKCVTNIIELIQARMESVEKLEELDLILGNVFNGLEVKLQENNGEYIL